MKERIKILLDHLGVTPAEFADTLKVPRSSVSHIISGRNNPSLEFLRKMLTAYPEISADWLLLGQGGISRKVLPGEPKVSNVSSPAPSIKPQQSKEENELEVAGPSPQATVPGNDRVREPVNLRGIENENREQNGPPVEKVIIFYADGTFQQYIPRNKT